MIIKDLLLQRLGLVLSAATLTGSLAAPVLAQAPAQPAPAAPSREAPFSPAAAPSSTATEPQLYERASFINVCRSSGAQPITVSANVTRTTFIATIPPFTRINLTGVVAYNNSGQVQYVQISQPLGYVPTATLQTNCGAGPTPPPTGKGACYTIRPAVAP